MSSSMGAFSQINNALKSEEEKRKELELKKKIEKIKLIKDSI